MYTVLVPQTFAEWFSELIENSGKPNKEWAFNLGVAASTIGDWRKGSYSPDADKLIKIADLAHANPLALISLVYGLPMPDGDLETTEQLARILRKAALLPDDVQLQAEAFIDFLAGRVRKEENEPIRKASTKVSSTDED